jgi:hypothetical protein
VGYRQCENSVETAWQRIRAGNRNACHLTQESKHFSGISAVAQDSTYVANCVSPFQEIRAAKT